VTSGIYTITAPSGGQYVGSAVDIAARWRLHRFQMRHGAHFNNGLQRAHDKYGMEALKFSTLLICRREDLIMYEQCAIDALKPRYNACPIAGSQLGRRHSAASKEKMSQSKKGQGLGRKRRPEDIEKWASKMRGRKRGPNSPESRAKQSASLKGKKHADSFEMNLTPSARKALVAAYPAVGLVRLACKNHVDHRVLRRILLAEGVTLMGPGPHNKHHDPSQNGS